MEIDFKKLLWTLAIVGALGWYVRTHYTFNDALAYATRNPDRDLSPKIEYYVGMAYYMRTDLQGATSAFNLLLTDYPTCQYAPKSLLRLGTIQMEEKKWEEARVSLQRYMDEFPSGPDIEIVRNKFEVIKFK